LHFILLAALTLGAADYCPLKAEDGPAAAGQSDAGTSKFSYVGSTNCHRCHRDPLPEDIERGAVKRFKLNEYKTWEHDDKHHTAFKALEGERGQTMSKLLAWDVNVTEDVRCLSCHSGHCRVKSAGAGKPVTVEPPAVVKRPADEKPYDIRAEGVSCEACHGPASSWVKAHWDPDMDPPFRTLPAKEKLEKYGLKDVRQPIHRAEICLSCHLGNPREGKVVTHEMYAAGHPPLPGFEIETFDAAMPPHAKLFEEKPPESLPKWNYPAGDIYDIRALVTAGLMSFRFQVRLLAEQAAAAESGSKNHFGGSAWPELALFDCRACHHDLRASLPRRASGEPGRPGRPAFQSWPLAIYLVAGGDESPLNALYKAFDRQPFGKAADVLQAASELELTIQAQIDQNEQRAFDRAEGLQLLRRICSVDEKLYNDYDSARQLSWAFVRIYKDITSGPDGSATIPPARRVEIDKSLQQLTRELHLTIEPLPATALDVAQRRLETAANYDPQSFKAQLETLSGSLPAGQ
jgi:hypothetical protein